jgi:hypothetical protein
MEGDAGMSHRLLKFAVKNVAGVACTIGGYPTLRVFDAHGAPLTSRVTLKYGASYFVPEHPATPVSLSPGKSAWFGIEYSLAGDLCVEIGKGEVSVLEGSKTAMPFDFADKACPPVITISPFQ